MRVVLQDEALTGCNPGMAGMRHSMKPSPKPSASAQVQKWKHPVGHETGQATNLWIKHRNL